MIGVRVCLGSIATSVLVAMLAITISMGPASSEDIVGIPNLSYRTGPFASTGTPLMNGQRDYMMMINERDGGINGVKLGYEECETAYSTERGVECYEKTKATGLVVQPWSTGITSQLLPRLNADRVPLLAPGYGFSAMADGKTFKWAFNMPASYWDGVSMILRYLSGGNLDTLRGKKIGLLYLDAPYGKEPIPFLQSLAAKYGFTLLLIPVTPREMLNQAAQWQEIARENPDYVLMWGWGAMNTGALSEAVKTGFPMDRFVGIWWSGHDGDMKTIGEAGKGYRSLSWNFPVSDAPAMQDIKKYVLDPKKTEIGDGEFESVFYQRGVLISMFTVEAIRAAQEHFDTRLVNAEQLRWGFENLKLDEDRLAQIGMTDMIAPFATSCEDHTGHSGAWMLEWDGKRFVKVSDLLRADQAEIAPLVDQEANAFVQANAPWAINEECRL
ncbi:MAG: ABC transporter substrate-binding protein [Mesorhizobium sp.]|nr:ABC transporter substrate-binding protein [Mesorhizobium sp.]MBL8578468.1 ABC transporter substrate-binding protein [Mesorhizobium sp.]